MPHLLFEPPVSGFIGHGRGRMHWLKPFEHDTITHPPFNFKLKDPVKLSVEEVFLALSSALGGRALLE